MMEIITVQWPITQQVKELPLVLMVCKIYQKVIYLEIQRHKENGQITSDTDNPPLVIREIVANQIVHQDFSVKALPTIEIFDNRIVFTNQDLLLIVQKDYLTCLLILEMKI